VTRSATWRRTCSAPPGGGTSTSCGPGRTLQPYHENPPDRLIGEDDIAFCDFGPIFEEWEADFGRTFVLGEAPAKIALRDALPVVWNAGREWFETHPDISGDELFRPDRHPIVRRTGDPGQSVPGTVFMLSATELAAADGYEVEDYRRAAVTLGSGTGSWVYVAAGRAGWQSRDRRHQVRRRGGPARRWSSPGRRRGGPARRW
jgi:Metallopeptidase family M24/Gamma-glutamyl cyclotransferase, AIG2-like